MIMNMHKSRTLEEISHKKEKGKQNKGLKTLSRMSYSKMSIRIVLIYKFLNLLDFQ
jgi:hypothetical protein